MDKERCIKCRFFKKPNVGARGNCRRFPPTVYDKNKRLGGIDQSYPQMLSDDWCGEFKYKDKFIDLVANHKPNTNIVAPDFNIVAPDFTTTTESFDPKTT